MKRWYNGILARFLQTRENAVKANEEYEVAYSFLRFSELGRQARGQSMRRQTGVADGWLARHPRIRLDATLRMREEGVSAFSGEHRKNPARALGAFLRLVEDGTVRPGSW